MKRLPSRLRRLDGALADLPLEEPMLLTELDGFLTGIVVCPVAIASGEWMQNIWGADDGGGVAPFDDPLDVQWFADAVMARYAEIGRDLDRGRLQPIFDVDDRNGDVLWEMWIDGFAEAMALRPESWTGSADGEDQSAATQMSLLIAVARNESALDSVQINALQDQTPADIADIVQRLYPMRHRAEARASTVVKTGRNDPCHCGSGRKFKRCCA